MGGIATAISPANQFLGRQRHPRALTKPRGKQVIHWQ
jgi:hypothetical protein